MIKSSGLKAASSLIYSGHCRLRGVSFSATTTASTPTLTVSNSITTSAAAALNVAFGVAELVEGVSATNYVIKFSAEDNLDCETGLWADLSATTGKYIIYYEIL